jgi:hypothetical protein
MRFVIAVLLLAWPLAAADDPTYAALRAARPDGRSISLANAEFDRDVYHFTLSGSLSLLAPVNGATFGAVFVGTGSYTLTPASEAEKRQLAMNTGDDQLAALSDTFGSAVFFDPLLVAELQKTAGEAKLGEVSVEASKVFDDFLKRERKDFTTNFHIRLLQEILDPQGQPLFFAFVDGKRLPPAILAVDPRGADSLRLFAYGDDGETSVLYVQDATKGGIWYLAHPAAGTGTGRPADVAPVATAERYEIDTTIGAGNEIGGTTVMTFTGRLGGRVLGLSLAPKLRIDSVEVSPAGAAPAWQPVPFIQENEDEDADAAVVFPSPLGAGVKYLLRTKYHGVGKVVLRDAGDGNFTVGARDSWYPNIGSFRDPADFVLTFRLPQKSKNQIVAVGLESETRIEDEQRISVWKSAHPLRVAGFNFGNFKKMTQTDDQSGLTVEVYTNPGDPDALVQIQQAIAASSDEFGYFGGGSLRVDTAGLAQAAFADGANTARTGNVYFGPLDDKRIAITQQSAWFSGQSWPTLVYLPYLAFVDSTTRNMMGFGADLAEFVDQVGAHEVAHQWWGHRVGWGSYHDAWLSEGFAEFTSGLVLQMRKGFAAYNAFYEKKRKALLERPRGADVSANDAGPISQGYRLSTWRNPWAYQTVVYEKGAYVLQMLRMAMMDPRKENSDEAFIAMMRDFAATYAGKNPTTEDFQRIVEKHAPPKLKLRADGNVGWFFDQWVRGTAIPRLTAKLAAQPTAGGKYRISGTIAQSEVPDDFAVVVPVYLVFDKGAMSRLGGILLVGNTSKSVDLEVALPKRPKSVVINAMHDILSR